MTEPRDESCGPTEGPDAVVGSVSEEAAKLLGAVADWAREQGSDVGDGLANLAGQAAVTAGKFNEHIATDDPECRYCPVCRSVHAVRSTSPEVRAHLATAASSLLQAAAGLLATVAASENRSDRPVEHIDLDPDQDGDA